MLEKEDLRSVRINNFQIVCNYMIKNIETTIPAISKDTKLSLPTVTRLLNSGLEKKLFFKSEIADSTGGRKPQQYIINKNFSLTLLVTLDNDILRYELRNFVGEVIDKDKKEIVLKDYIYEIDLIVSRLILEYNTIKYLAIALPCIVNNGRIIEWNRNSFLNGYAVSDYFESNYNLLTTIENAMKCTALSASQRVEGSTKATIATIQFKHNGVGCGIATGGEIFRGGHGFSGEIEFLPSKHDYENHIGTLAQILISIIAVIDPSKLIIYETKNQENLNQLRGELSKTIPSYAMPKLIQRETYIDDVFDGLYALSEKNSAVPMD